eukprot:4947816-Amphidinium_carterae.1
MACGAGLLWVQQYPANNVYSAEVEAVRQATVSTNGLVIRMASPVINTWRKMRRSGWQHELAEATAWIEIWQVARGRNILVHKIWSHQECPQTDGYAKEAWIGNARADHLARAQLQSQLFQEWMRHAKELVRRQQRVAMFT